MQTSPKLSTKTVGISIVICTALMLIAALSPFYMLFTQPLAAGIIAALIVSSGILSGLVAGIVGFSATAAVLALSLFKGVPIPEILIGAFNLAGLGVVSGWVIGLLMRKLKSFNVIVLSGAGIWLFSMIAAFFASLLIKSGTISMEAIGTAINTLTSEMVDLLSQATNQTAPEVRPYIEATVKTILTVLPGSSAVIAMVSSFLSLTIAKFVVSRFYHGDVNYLLPIEFFKVSPIGGGVFLVAFVASLFVKDAFFTVVLSNFVTIMAAPMMLSAIGLGIYFLKRSTIGRAGGIGCAAILLVLLVPLLFQMAGFIAAIGAIDAIFDYRKLVKK